MYSGLLPKGLTEEELSPEDEQDDTEDGVDGEKESPAEKSTHTACDPDSHSTTCTMPGVSQDMWQKFQDLKKKNEEMKIMKFTRRRRRRRPKRGAKHEEPTETSRKLQEEQEKPWDELQQYFGVNDRFYPPACSKPPPKSGLEKSTERAIAEGDIAKAEEMSDRLATRELAVKIAQAADCRDFVQRKQEEEALRAAQKRKKDIPWGFEAKKRWETKSNMGFM
ncbi:protein FAM204A isoform X3 [Notolabrus celidotus]|uniref:protein FAM204A isoform X3 n=1 Tax=Notolabrus celidotus TaxID=1203425 RepID=UPI0014905C90|nr:protein FAM204A isoform X3 [Notolabrus celidotus]